MTMIQIESLFQPALEQRRGKLDEPRIQYYLRHPEKVRGVLVYEDPYNGERILVNGYHRTEAARRLNWSEIEADLQPGTRVDAQTYWDPVHKPWSEIEAEANPSEPKPE